MQHAAGVRVATERHTVRCRHGRVLLSRNDKVSFCQATMAPNVPLNTPAVLTQHFFRPKVGNKLTLGVCYIYRDPNNPHDTQARLPLSSSDQNPTVDAIKKTLTHVQWHCHIRSVLLGSNLLLPSLSHSRARERGALSLKTTETFRQQLGRHRSRLTQGRDSYHRR